MEKALEKEMVEMNEEKTKFDFISPAILKAGWENSRIKLEFPLTNEKFKEVGQRVVRYRADYVLFADAHIPLAVVEAKSYNKSPYDGLEQAMSYAKMIDAPFALSTNGKMIVEHDFLLNHEREYSISEMPTRESLMKRLIEAKSYGETEQNIVFSKYALMNNGRTPRYYQFVACNRVLEEVAKGRKKMMVVMATGVGKTFTSFQIIHRLREAKVAKKILFLADRKTLISQTHDSEFGQFNSGENIMEVVKKGEINSSKSIFLALYQGLSKDKKNEEELDTTNEMVERFKKIDKDFFDLIIIDECHRGVVSSESSWRKILEHFDSAIQVGLTATPKIGRVEDRGNNMDYFGEPVYQYSLSRGISEGYLAPFKLIRYYLDKDKDGIAFNGEFYTGKDFERIVVATKRRKKIAKILNSYLRGTDMNQKTIIFCENIKHAQAMTSELKKLTGDMQNNGQYEYVERITGDREDALNVLEAFKNKEFPMIVTTSKMLTTGVDTKMVKLIVLDSNIKSPTEFKQIIGRGSRLVPEKGKHEFTIMDFRNASKQFENVDFDGEPLQSAEVDIYGGDHAIPENWVDKKERVDENQKDEQEKSERITIDNTEFELIGTTITYFDENLKMIREEDVLKYMSRKIKEYFSTPSDLIEIRIDKSRRLMIENFLSLHSRFWAIALEQSKLNTDKYDIIEKILAIGFDYSPMNRSQKSSFLEGQKLPQLDNKQREVLSAILLNYEEGSNSEFSYSTVLNSSSVAELFDLSASAVAKKYFGSIANYQTAMQEIEFQFHHINRHDA
jgi:type I restriction enzyme R subunit